MEYLRKNDMETTVSGKSAYLLSRLSGLKKKYPVIGDVDGLGLAIRIEMTKPDRFTPDRQLTDRIFQEGMKGDIKMGRKKYGLVLDVGGYYKNVFTLAPALTIARKEMDLFVELFLALLRRCGCR